MNNEIKEILDKLKKKSSIYKFQINQGTSFNTDEYEASILLDYITNLQQENERLKELCDKYEEEHKTTFKMWEKDLKNFEHEKNRELKSRINRQENEIEELKAKLEMYENGVYYSSENDKLQEKIDKAIEYIEEKGRLKYKPDELLKILKGENNE